MLNKYRTNIFFNCHHLAVIALLLLLFSCNPAKKVTAGNYLLDKNIVTVNDKNVSKGELEKYIKQIPNRRIAGFKFNLWLYNHSKDKKDNRWNRWLRKTGEPPVLYDSLLRKRSSQQMLLYLHNLGYYNSAVSDTVELKGKHAYVYFTINAGEPYRINNLSYHFEDSTLMPLIYKDSTNCLVKKGDLFDLNQLQNEQRRIENYLKNKGYYNFNKDYVYFEADSNLNNHKVDVVLGFTKYIYRDSSNILHTNNHRRYFIRNVFVIPQYDPTAHDSLFVPDTIPIDSIYFLCKGEQKHNPHIVEQSIVIQPNNQFNLKDVDETYKKLSLLRNFKFINIIFKEDVKNYGHEGDYSLDCYIQLSPYLAQSYQAEIEGTNNNANFGAATNLIYQHKNVFKRAQVFDFKIHGAYEAIRKQNNAVLYNTYQIGAESRLNIPQFLVPFKSEHFIRKYSPKTSITLSYNYQLRPDYNQKIANISFGYNWKGSSFTTFVVNPVDIYYVLPNITDVRFDSIVKNSFQRYSFQKVFINALSASLTFNNQTNKNSRYYYFNLRGETAGAMLRATSDLIGLQKENNIYHLFGTDYAQYVKADFEFRFNQPLNSTDRIAYRIFAGIGLPYKNSKSMPFIRRYFSGGSSGLRGWLFRSLGPGSSKSANFDGYPNQAGDMKLEGNIEYRFKLIGKMEGAMFIDAGNIWNVQQDDPVGSQFHFNTFYNQIAVSTGVGLRFDFSFFIIRLDVGFKTRDPLAPIGKRWIITNNYFTKPDYISSSAKFSNNYGFNFAIGYPF